MLNKKRLIINLVLLFSLVVPMFYPLPSLAAGTCQDTYTYGSSSIVTNYAGLQVIYNMKNLTTGETVSKTITTASDDSTLPSINSPEGSILEGTMTISRISPAYPHPTYYTLGVSGISATQTGTYNDWLWGDLPLYRDDTFDYYIYDPATGNYQLLNDEFGGGINMWNPVPVDTNNMSHSILLAILYSSTPTTTDYIPVVTVKFVSSPMTSNRTVGFYAMDSLSTGGTFAYDGAGGMTSYVCTTSNLYQPIIASNPIVPVSLNVNINTNGASASLCQNGTLGAGYTINSIANNLTINPCNPNVTYAGLPSGIYEIVPPQQIYTKIGSQLYLSKLVSVSPASTINITDGATGTFNIEYKTLPVLDVH